MIKTISSAMERTRRIRKPIADINVFSLPKFGGISLSRRDPLTGMGPESCSILTMTEISLNSVLRNLIPKVETKLKPSAEDWGHIKNSGFIGFCQVIHTPFGEVKAHRIFADILLKLLSF
ncbi:hypothetical protein [uncultured Oscillibacter sp.]|uniref:hypothetical protein n=1 Tax=uncultured Oscillibacter sp. TaxID=876091 RepID=UPI00280BDF4E|nr:hypothetical protein [uncultured Oscillibacter sp.]